jgi:orotidine-5'-phosphate decarboxylase
VHKWAETAKAVPPKILAVTVLTSLADPDLPMVGVKGKIRAQVERLAELAKRCGVDGVVASPHEIEAIRNLTGKDFLIVTPGVRPVWAARGDQKRVMTPREAIEKGADYIVVGRPITQAPDPLEAARKILSEIK